MPQKHRKVGTAGEAAAEAGVCFPSEKKAMEAVVPESRVFPDCVDKRCRQEQADEGERALMPIHWKLPCVLPFADNGISPEEKDLFSEPSHFSADPVYHWHCRAGLWALRNHQRWCLPAHPLRFRGKLEVGR